MVTRAGLGSGRFDCLCFDLPFPVDSFQQPSRATEKKNEVQWDETEKVQSSLEGIWTASATTNEWFCMDATCIFHRKRQEEQRKAEELKRMQREQRRKEKHLQKLRQKETDEISLKILQEERKLMETQRKLESIRLIDALFERMKVRIELMTNLCFEQAKSLNRNF